MTAHAPGSINPADLKALEPVKASTPDEVRAAVATARTAQANWVALPLATRADAMRALGQAVLAKADELAKLMSMETGRSVVECKASELTSLVPYIETAIVVAKEALAPSKVRLSMLDFPGKKGVTEAVPRGVIGIIAPWNYPLGNFWKSLFPALLSGNGVVLKPSEHTPRTGALLAGLCAEVMPKGLVGLVQGAGEVGQALVDTADAIVFTGSVPSGKRVAARAAERLIPTSLELGGKDAALVLADCDLDRTAIGVAQWAMHNCGQNCAAIERVYVEEAIADRFVATLSKVVSKLRVSTGDNESDLGPLQNAAQLAIVEKHVEQAKAKGAKVTAGGARVGPGLGFQATVLDHCSDDMDVVRDETFGPVIAVVRVKDAEDGLKRANDSRYGLNGSVWTTNLERGAALVRRMEVGVGYVNNHGFAGILADVPWTGVKETGPGVAASAHSYGVFTRPRTVIIDSGKQPDAWWIPANAELTQFVDALIARGRGGGLGVLLKLGGLVKKRAAAIRELAR
ncbi:MAG: aldehyde dehydrogenase family protein [Archangium sp.]|nr:aldehyde dehydrogenase family protein [Archangium sp.]